ncbi:MAG: acyl-CoA dehydrogenase family protein [Ilumatobacteraceae bacterium]|nr:acyl-CoA dehydrogenase family protein [Ilumatobacteraceae bacterium]
MDLTYPPEAEAFRSVVRDWLDEELPDGWFHGDRPTGSDWIAFCDAWNERIHATGWATPTWPTEYGGRGLQQIEAIVLAEELANSGVPIQPPAGGEILLGPTVLHWGTPEQKARFLPPIARGEEIWCQGFSEPDSGSDLASLRTSAVRDGSDWRVNGHKIWTSQAQDADYCFMLVRSDPETTRHQGISYILMPMDQPGVEVRTIVQPDGTAGFAEVFFDDAICPVENTVGPIGEGWRVAMSTLGFERGTSATSSWQRYARDLDAMIARAHERGLTDDPIVRQALARAHTEIDLMRIGGLRVLTSVLHPERQAATAALEAGTKIAWTEAQQRLTNLAIDLMGADGQILSGADEPAVGVGLGDRAVVHDYPAGAVQSAFLFALAGTIFGGTSEIQRNIVAERVLGLPREPR